MAVYIHPGKVSGIVTVPSSKSLSHRVLIASLLCEEECVISNLCICDDVTATLEIIKSLGKEVTVVNGNYYIKPANGISNYVLNANESGSTLRFLIPIVSLYNNEFIFKGSKKLLSRPLDVYKKIYDSQSLKFELNEDYLKVSGKLSSGVYEIPGNISSQFITGLLFTLPLLDGDSCIKIIGKLESISYVDMTIDILNKFGVKVDFKDNEIFIPGNQKYSKCDYNVPGDYSQMAFWAVLGTLYIKDSY